MNDFYKMASILSFVGAVAFVFIAFENGKLALVAMAFVMLCNGINFWMKCNEKVSEIGKKAEDAKE